MAGKPRKKWSTTTDVIALRKHHTSEAGAFAWVRQIHEDCVAGRLAQDVTTVSVWVDEGSGRGWELFDRLRVSDLASV